MVERFVHTEEVTGSNPVSPTAFGRMFAEAIADYLDADRAITIERVIPFELHTA